MSLLHAIILGAIQGLTEFIPVSSSGHLIAIPHLLGWAEHSKSFDAALHLGTLAALLIYYWRDWVRIISSFLAHVLRGRPYEKDTDQGASGRLFVPIVIACVPAAIVGYKWDDVIEHTLTKWYFVAGALVVFGLLMFAGEKMGRKLRDIGKMNYGDYITIGLAQALALFPGVSRSGVTITAGLFRDLNREAAARFSFLLSTPIVMAAGLFATKNINLQEVGVVSFVAGILTSAIFGYAAIHFLISFLKNKPVTAFVVYRIAFAGVLVGTFLYR